MKTLISFKFKCFWTMLILLGSIAMLQGQSNKVPKFNCPDGKLECVTVDVGRPQKLIFHKGNIF